MSCSSGPFFPFCAPDFKAVVGWDPLEPCFGFAALFGSATAPLCTAGFDLVTLLAFVVTFDFNAVFLVVFFLAAAFLVAAFLNTELPDAAFLLAVVFVAAFLVVVFFAATLLTLFFATAFFRAGGAVFFDVAFFAEVFFAVMGIVGCYFTMNKEVQWISGRLATKKVKVMGALLAYIHFISRLAIAVKLVQVDHPTITNEHTLVGLNKNCITYKLVHLLDVNVHWNHEDNLTVAVP